LHSFIASPHPMTAFTIDVLQPDDWPAVRAIYLEGIATRNATFETESPSWEQWDAARRPDCRLVARQQDTVLGFAALSPVSSRQVYRGVAEATIYVAAAHRGRGIGTALMNALVEASEAAGVWTLQAAVFPENAGSLRLTARSGFRVVGTRSRLAKHYETWRDVLLLERRSERVGLDT
jgi:L-amino acid N-acyltransferase YncA